jgi:hypothetical protein
MATLFISFIGGVENGVASKVLGSATVTTSGTSAKTATAAPTGASIAIVVSDAAHYVAFGPQATVTAAAANGIYVPANIERHVAINAGNGIAAITA